MLSVITRSFAVMTPIFPIALIRRALLSLLCLAAVAGLHAQSASNYRISPNDLLKFRVFEQPDLDAEIRVSGDGSAIFPLIGSVNVGGKTIAEATQNVTERLKDGYFVNPQVSITVGTYAKKLFTVLGQVQKPGAYDMLGLDEITLLQAIGMAGGYTKTADPSAVTLKRVEAGKEKVTRYNAKKMAHESSSASVMIRPGDVITVAESLF
jgi:polysaccharide export outer membrane protein